MYTIFLTNHGYEVGQLFPTFEEAVAWIKSKLCFECSIYRESKLVAHWSPINGLDCRHVNHYLDHVDSLMDTPHKICSDCDKDLGRVN